MHTQCRIELFHVKMPFCSQTSRLGRTIIPNGVAPQADKLKEFFSKLRLLSQIKKGGTEVYRIFKLLPKLHTTPFGTALSVLQTPQRNLQTLRTNKFGRSLHKPQQTPRIFLPVSIKTTTEKQATYSHVQCMFHSSRICYHDRRRPEPNTPIQTQNICTRSISFNVFNPTQTKMSICEKNFFP